MRALQPAAQAPAPAGSGPWYGNGPNIVIVSGGTTMGCGGGLYVVVSAMVAPAATGGVMLPTTLRAGRCCSFWWLSLESYGSSVTVAAMVVRATGGVVFLKPLRAIGGHRRPPPH